MQNYNVQQEMTASDNRVLASEDRRMALQRVAPQRARAVIPHT
jgi:hypothetical protein